MLPPLGVATRHDCALVVIDIQERLAAAMEHAEAAVAAAGLLIRTASLVQVPVIVTRQYPRGLGDTHPGVAEVLAEVEASGAAVTVVDKTSFDCFAEPVFADAVCGTGRRQLVIAGMETHICVAQTSLAGLREGYDVHVAADACCSREAYHHDVATRRLTAAGAVVTLSESVAYELVGQAGTPEFKQLLAAVKTADAGR